MGFLQYNEQDVTWGHELRIPGRVMKFITKSDIYKRRKAEAMEEGVRYMKEQMAWKKNLKDMINVREHSKAIVKAVYHFTNYNGSISMGFKVRLVDYELNGKGIWKCSYASCFSHIEDFFQKKEYVTKNQDFQTIKTKATPKEG